MFDSVIYVDNFCDCAFYLQCLHAWAAHKFIKRILVDHGHLCVFPSSFKLSHSVVNLLQSTVIQIVTSLRDTQQQLYILCPNHKPRVKFGSENWDSRRGSGWRDIVKWMM